MCKVQVVAELGINHNGDCDIALRMVDAAARAGCDAIKLQLYTAEEFCSPSAVYNGVKQVALFRKYQLDPRDVGRIVEHAHGCNLKVVATVMDQASIEVATCLEVDWLKIASGDLTHERLLTAVANVQSIPSILSTGMATLREIDVAVDILRPEYLLHCVSLYPCPIAEANIMRMSTLWNIYNAKHRRSYVPHIGYSDHTIGPVSAVVAVARGADMIEKHFTLDNNMDGLDHGFSETPTGMRLLVEKIKAVQDSLGDEFIEPSPSEWRMRQIARRKVVAKVDIKSGATLTWNHLCVQRHPAGMYDASEIDTLIGRKVFDDIPAGSPIAERDFEDAYGE